MSWEAWLAAAGVKIGSLIGGFLGAVVSLKFVEGLNYWQRGTTVLAGGIGAAYGGPLVIAAFSLSSHLEAAVCFLIGLFGMSFAGAFIKAMPEWVSAAKERIFR